MHEQLIATYHDLMRSLQTLPNDIAAAQEALTSLKRDVQFLQQQADAAQGDWIAAQGGWKALGSNEKERELALGAFTRGVAMRKLAGQQALNAAAVDDAAQGLATLERRYGAICFQVRLHSALLQYLGNAGAAITLPAAPSGGGYGIALAAAADVPFYSESNNTSNAAVTLADAQAIGL